VGRRTLGHPVNRVLAVGLAVLIWFSLISAFAAANTIPTSSLSDTTRAITPDDLKPNQCNGITLTGKLVWTSGTLTGTGAAELLLGTGGANSINGGGGNDCIVGGGGADTLTGGSGMVVILGGPGNDTIDGGPAGGSDTCYGGAGTDTFTSCETIFDP
jgi:Ca2+-binding RTX toxin-like protein